MKNNLLICTQEINKNSTTLGFMTSWVAELAKHYDKVFVICLYMGEYDLPENVKVFSLEKEKNKNKLFYIFNFYRILFTLRGQYKKVFVHMNDEYLYLGAFIWKITGKKLALWSNHYHGYFLRDIFGKFCDNIFFTSKFSYTANKTKFPQAKQMPVGVSLVLPEKNIFEKKNNQLLFLARLDPSKKPEVILHALKILKDKNINNFKIYFVGGTSHDKFPGYEDKIKNLKSELGLGEEVVFCGGVPSKETFRYYQESDIYINVAKSGMLDKTIFESLVGGCLPLTTSVDFNEMINKFVGDDLKVEQDNSQDLAQKLEKYLKISLEEKQKIVKELQELILEKHSLKSLAREIAKEI